MRNLHLWLWLLSVLSRSVSFVLSHWLLALLALFLLSPIGPHLRWEYTYHRGYYGSQKVFIRCTYLGSRGFITPEYVAGCPVIAFHDARDWGA